MSLPDPGPYPPMTRRHKAIFAIAGTAMLVIGGAVAYARLRLVFWWIGHCPGDTIRCGRAEWAIDYWWLVLVGVCTAIAFVAHWMTRDRLERPS